jgi:uncharacterized OB-fold protein
MKANGIGNGHGNGSNSAAALAPPATAMPGAEVAFVEDHVEGTTCAACGFLHVPARTFRCQNCGGHDLQATRVALRGTLVTFTVLPAPVGEAPRGLAIVRLDAGPCITASLAVHGPMPGLGDRVEGRVEQVREHDQLLRRLRVSVVAPLRSSAAMQAKVAESP